MNLSECVCVVSSTVFHKPLRIRFEDGLEYVQSDCGLVASPSHDITLIPHVGPISPYIWRKGCKKCYGKWSNVRKTVLVKLPSWKNPSVMTFYRGNLHYQDYPQNIGSYNPTYHEVVGDYGLVDWDDEDERLKAVLRKTDEYPPEKGFSLLTGWLLPNGDFYPCDTREHDSMAYYIYRFLFRELLDGIGTVESLGWRRICKSYVAYVEKLPTREQIETMMELASLSEVEEFKEDVADWVEMWERQ
jgi:hypothetical protein